MASCSREVRSKALRAGCNPGPGLLDRQDIPRHADTDEGEGGESRPWAGQAIGEAREGQRGQSEPAGPGLLKDTRDGTGRGAWAGVCLHKCGQETLAKRPGKGQGDDDVGAATC